MAFDGTVVAGLAHEFNEILTGGHISKIAQPEKDAVVITVKNNSKAYKLFLSASPSLPLAYITEEQRESPLTAPNFCMLLRKHLQGGKIIGVDQPGLERIIRIKAEHLDEMGDLTERHLNIEIMGKYSNLILIDENEKVIDAIKRVNMLVSSVREVLPGRDYFVPEQEGRINPFDADLNYFKENIAKKTSNIRKAIYTSLTGFSSCMANELCERAGLDADESISALNENDIENLYNDFAKIINDIKTGNFSPCVYYKEDGTPAEFSAFHLSMYKELKEKEYNSFSEMLENYYGERDAVYRVKQRSTDLRRVISNAIERESGKLTIFEKQLKDTADRDKYRKWGELITTYGYSLKGGEKELIANDFETGEEVKIKLDPEISAIDNAKKYFDKYARLKRTFEAVTKQKAETEEELEHLESVNVSLTLAQNEGDLNDIRHELIDYGYIKKHESGGKKKKEKKSKPLHFISSDGFDIYVGKNNYQNDYLTFKLANGGDWWFHAKKCAGSHVILVTNGREVPDRAFNEAGKLAVHFSSANTVTEASGDGNKHEVDYVLKKEVKKPNGAKPGFVVYYTNYSLMADSDITGIKEVP